MPPLPARVRRLARPLPILLLGTYTFAIRVHGIHRHFWMYGDQMRDWAIATGPLAELPLVGTPSTVGGTSLGPVFYWTLWTIAHTLGPWFDRLPHAGGIGLAALQSAADMLLASALWRRLGSLAAAAAVVLLAASSPHDLAFSATIWNPVLAVALAKTALALVLIPGERPAPARVGGAAGAAWLAVQAHSGALFVAATVFLWFIVRELRGGAYGRAAATAAGLAGVVLALQVPFLVHVARHSTAGVAPEVVLRTVGQVGEPGAFSLARSAAAVGDALEVLVAGPFSVPGFLFLLLACAIVLVALRRRQPDLLFATVVPIALAIAGFAPWTRPFDSYWFLALVPSAVLLAVCALLAIVPARRAGAAAAILLIAAVAVQPPRVARSREFLRLPEYEALVRGSRQIARYGAPVARVEADFVDPEVDREVLLRLLGGHIDRHARLAAVIEPDGRAVFKDARR